MKTFNWITKLNWRGDTPPMLKAASWVAATIVLLNLVFIPGFFLFSHSVSFSAENTDTVAKLQNARDAIQQETDAIGVTTRDYADWDDTYNFVNSHDMAFISVNLDANVQKNLNIDYAAVIDSAGQIIYSSSLELDEHKITPIRFDTAALIKKYPQLTAPAAVESEGVKGLVALDGRIMLLAARPILTSQYLGPARGTFIFGRFLDADENQHLEQVAHLTLVTQDLTGAAGSTEMQAANYALVGEAALPVEGGSPANCAICHPNSRGSAALAAGNADFITPFNDDLLGGYTLLHDIQQTPIAILAIHVPRSIEQLETRNTSLFLVCFFGLLLVAGVIVTLIITRAINAEEALDGEYNLLRAVVDNVPEQIYVHDTNGRYLLNNLYDAQVMGVNNPEEMIGKSDFDYYPAELAGMFHESEMGLIQSGESMVDMEGVMTRSDGRKHWILTTKKPLRDKRGQIRGIVGVSRDITERKQRERELEVIVTMSRALRFAETSNSLLFMIYRQVIDLLHADFGTLELVDPASGDAEVVYSYGVNNSLQGLHTPADEGLNSYIRASRKPYLENDLAHNPKALDALVYNGCTAVAGAPMFAEGQLIGFLWMGRRSSITEDELGPLAAMADIAASSIRRMSLHELTEKRLNRLASLRKIDASINNSKELEESLEVLMGECLTQLEADAAEVLLLSQDFERLDYISGQGFRTNLFNHHSMHLSDGPAGRAAQTRKPVEIRDLKELAPGHPLGRASIEEGFSAYFAAPLLVGSEIKGVLEVFCRKEFRADADWVSFLETLAGQAAIAIEQVQLYQGLAQSNAELVQAYDETIEGWVKALDLRDRETEGHSLRVAKLCTELASEMGIKGEELAHIRRGALLHDIGKVGVPDQILLKPGELTPDEWVIMRQHPQFAQEMLSPIRYLRPALDIPFGHHEKWDGSGYPRGLKGEEIALAARIFSIIDVWDALSSDRPYRRAWPEEKVLKYIQEQSGIHFDPGVVEAFLRMKGY